jgi:hypothetical protein
LESGYLFRFNELVKLKEKLRACIEENAQNAEERAKFRQVLQISFGFHLYVTFASDFCNLYLRVFFLLARSFSLYFSFVLLRLGLERRDLHSETPRARNPWLEKSIAAGRMYCWKL